MLALKRMRFEFPLACMLSEQFRRRVVAGRCASVSHEVDKFSRNMAPTGLMGQAAGALAAVMSRSAHANWSSPPVDAVRTLLEESGVPVSLAPGDPHPAIDKDSVLSRTQAEPYV